MTAARRPTLALGITLLAAAGCAPRVRPLAGAPAPETARLPRIELAATPQRIVFRWRYEEEGFSARGEGAARVSPPDSARLDFFLDGGFGSGWAVLLGDSVRSPGGNVVQRLIPPAPMLWAALGRLAVPPGRDTTIRLAGDTLSADIAGADRTWRVVARGGQLARLERVQEGRVVERLTRDAGAVRYSNLVARRGLSIDVQRVEATGAHPASIWGR